MGGRENRVIGLVGALGFVGYSAWDRNNADAGSKKTVGKRNKTKKPSNVKKIYTVVSYNIRFDTPVNKMLQDMAKITRNKPDIITLQETTRKDRNRAIVNKYACKRCDYNAYAPTKRGENEIIIMWNKKEFTKKWTVSKQIATTSSQLRKVYHVNSVQLKLNSDNRRIRIVTNHLPASIDTNGSWRPGANSFRKSTFAKNINEIQ